MANVIFTNRENGSWSWMVATKGSKYITLRYVTSVGGDHDVTLKYNISDEAALLATLNDPLCSLAAILEFGWGPKPVKVVTHEAIR